MTGKYAQPEVTIRSYQDSPICDVVVVVRGQEMVLYCRDYRQAMRWARLERKTYKIPEPDTGFPANEESRDLPLFCVQIEIDLCSAWSAAKRVAWFGAISIVVAVILSVPGGDRLIGKLMQT
jgi:hypothetical protein